MATSRGGRRHRRLSAIAAVALLFFATALDSHAAQFNLSLPSPLLPTPRRKLGGRRRPRQRGGGGEPAGRRRRRRPEATRRARVVPAHVPRQVRQVLPCRPVHVAVHPGRIIPLDYYPEAWRCKCGSKLFMP
ncbi:unnamed protein product [Spirodela intermedia]|uniref:Uncharacterized protein n=1 Tax=Spirodela intermedia TaxID=51605 RepID=A0A7I8IKU0_SPIIN|nr:unnamed protein product [Spirodela intermedia]CAA2618780.1 unnamed protein product [Spirodela intermedia]CAA6658499.1 unnamed protein product [Spirodela intermedia]CAA6658502.1 unnamed protein product [Spirodela intermedia]